MFWFHLPLQSTDLTKSSKERQAAEPDALGTQKDTLSNNLIP